MSYDGGEFWITFNGEIYNYLEIRAELEGDGCAFHSDSDTEVLLAAYSKWGRSCLDKLNGMFAFAILDKRNDELFLARDRFGIKPLYYYSSPKGIAFFSEIKQLPELGYYHPQVNYEQLYHFLNSGDFEFSSASIWRDVREIPPGHCVTLGISKLTLGEVVKPVAWYAPKIAENSEISFQDASSEFKRLLENALKLRLRSDVPVGFLLSGGLDSSTLVGLAHLASDVPGGNLKTYSSCYDDKSVDEREYIQSVIEHTGADSCLHFPSPDDVLNSTDKVVWHNDLPILPGSPAPHWLLYEHIKKESDSRIVMLEGQGADEILCGYGDFQFASLYEKLRWQSLPTFGMRLLRYYLKHPQRPNVIVRKFRRIANLERLNYPAQAALRADFFFKNGEVPPIAVSREAKTVRDLHFNRLKILKYILHYVDRNSMAHSRETRVPFLDHQLVEFCLGLPTEFKVDAGISKIVMRDAIGDVLPDKVRCRYDKKGYSSPTAKWWRESWRNTLNDEIDGCGDLPFVNKDELRKTLASSLKDGGYFDPILWRLITLRRWTKIFNVQI